MMRVSYDLYYWKSAAGNPLTICRRLADWDVTGVHPSSDVISFRAAILDRWPEFADRISPWADDLGWRQPAGPVGLEAHFVTLTLPFSTPDAVHDELAALAERFGLVTFDPQRYDGEDDDDDLVDGSDSEASPRGAAHPFEPTERESRMDRATFAALLQKLGIGGTR
jgi:hypothetical protein